MRLGQFPQEGPVRPLLAGHVVQAIHHDQGPDSPAAEPLARFGQQGLELLAQLVQVGARYHFGAQALSLELLH
jgi:hypothetical protein